MADESVVGTDPLGGDTPRRVGSFELIEELGRGGMGVVYRARDLKLDREVALKRPLSELFGRPGFEARFLEEARSASKLMHPNITTVFEVFEENGVPWMVMELIKGASLRSLLSNRQPLSTEDVLKYAEGLTDALRAAHVGGVLHRDVNPNNILVGQDGRARLGDFGLARAWTEPAEPVVASAGTTETGTVDRIAGTRGYMAPEQVLGKKVDPRSDIFSLGVVLYELCTGEPAFARTVSGDWLDSLLHREPKAVSEINPEVPSEFQDVIHKAIAKRRFQRYQSANEMLMDIRAVRRRFDSDTGGSRPWLVRDQRKARVRTLSKGLAGAFAVAFVAWLYFTVRPAPMTEWTPRQLTTAPGWERQPAISPGGDLVVYVSNESGNSDIWLIGVQGGQPHRLTDDPGEVRDPTWYPDGSLIAFTAERDGVESIWKVPVLGGPGIMVRENGANPAISPDGTRLAFSMMTSAGMRRIAIAPLDEPSRTTILTHDKDGLWDHVEPTWSPDGRLLCYTDSRDLWLVPTAGGEARRLTNEHEVDAQPAWTHDGKWILFSSKRGGAYALWRVSPSGGRPHRITFGTGPEQDPSLDTKGARIVYSTWNRMRDIVLLDFETGERTRLPSASIESSPAFAADGGAFAFVSDRSGHFEMWLQPLGDGRPAEAPRRLTDHRGSVATPSFSPDGNWVAYHRVVTGSDVRRDIWIVSTAGGAPVQFTDTPNRDTNPAFSPDGSRIAFISDRSGREHVWVSRVSGGRAEGDPVQITFGEQADALPDWSPDGRLIAFIRGGDVWIVDVDRGAQAAPITDGAEAHMARWADASDSILVSGRWGTPRMHLRRIHIDDRRVEILRPSVVFGDVSAPGLFGASRDGRTVAYIETVSGGDLWIMDAVGGE